MDLAKLINMPLPAAGQQTVLSTTDKPCLWQSPVRCRRSFPDDESLYEHVSTCHIGRKKTDNLCLSCHWKNCTVVCSKRDHITSHIKVHIPVKPYKCSKCPRAFKRAQDLSKHSTKCHDESSLFQRQVYPRNISISSSITSPSISDASLFSSNLMSFDHVDENGNEGYMSDPGPGDQKELSANPSEIWQAKYVSKKRSKAMIENLTNRFRSFENSLHFKKGFH